MKSAALISVLGLLFATACGGATTTPAEPAPADGAAASCEAKAANSPEHCECLGGYVKGDIGDGQVACTDGDEELERTQQGIEGAVCCKKAAVAPAAEQK